MSRNASNASTSIYPGVTSADAQLLSSLFVNLLLSALLVGWFLLFRRRLPQIYASRCEGDPPPEPGLLGWVRSAFRHDRLWYLRHRGLDSLVYLTLLEYLVRCLAPCAVLGVAVLMPVYAQGQRRLDGLERVTLSNVGPGEALLWVPFALCVAFSGWIMLQLYLLYREVTRLRIVFRSLQRPENYVALVREIPRHLSAKQLSQHFDELLGRHHCVSYLVAVRSRGLPKLFRARERAIDQLERFMAQEDGPTVLPRLPWWWCAGCCRSRGPRVDGATYWRDELARIDAAIAVKQKKARQGAGVAFVSFRTIRHAQMVWQAQLHSGNFNDSFVPAPWVVEAPAPPESINFENLHISAYQRFWRVVAADAVNVLLIAALYVPVALFVAIANVDNFDSVPIFGAIVRFAPAAEGFVRGFLPSLGLAIVNLVFLALIRVVVGYIGFLDHASIHKSVLGRFFLFFVINNLIGITVGGSIVSVFGRISAGDLSGVVQLAAASMPKQSAFFVNYVMLLSLAGNAFYLSKPFHVVWRAFSLRFFWHSRRSRRNLDGPFNFRFESAIWPLVTFLFSLTFGLISPLILVFGLLYVCFAFVRERYDLCYATTTIHPSNGFIFPTLFTISTWSLITGQLVTLIVLLLFEFYLAPLLLVVVALNVLLFVLVQLKFSDLAKFGTLSQAPEAHGVIVPVDAYAQPFLLPPKTIVEPQWGVVEHQRVQTALPWGRFEAVAPADAPAFEEQTDSNVRFDPEADGKLVLDPASSGGGGTPRPTRLIRDDVSTRSSLNLAAGSPPPQRARGITSFFVVDRRRGNSDEEDDGSGANAKPPKSPSMVPLRRAASAQDESDLA